jgi:hypothetical protein
VAAKIRMSNIGLMLAVLLLLAGALAFGLVPKHDS